MQFTVRDSTNTCLRSYCTTPEDRLPTYSDIKNLQNQRMQKVRSGEGLVNRQKQTAQPNIIYNIYPNTNWVVVLSKINDLVRFKEVVIRLP